MAISDPRDISGLLVWYSAEAETGYSNGASMTRWSDLSGHNNHAIPQGDTHPQWQAATGPGSGPAVHFMGTGTGDSATTSYFQLPTGLMSAATAGEVFFYVRRDSGISAGNIGHLHGFSNPDFSFYTYSDGNIYDAFGSTTRKDSITPTMATDVWRRLDIWSAPSDWSMLLDGTVQHATSSNTVGWFNTPVIGTGAWGPGIASGGSRAPAGQR